MTLFRVLLEFEFVVELVSGSRFLLLPPLFLLLFFPSPTGFPTVAGSRLVSEVVEVEGWSEI